MVGTHPGGKPEAKLQLRKHVLDFRFFWGSHLLEVFSLLSWFRMCQDYT